jgi:hypothetical protein
VVVATYSGDSTFAGSAGSVTIDVGGSSGSSSPGSFTLSATNISVTQGNSGSSTIAVTSHNSYAGTVKFQLSTDSTSLAEYGCYDIANATVAANQTTTATLTIHTAKADCTSSSIRKGQRYSLARSAISSSVPFRRNQSVPVSLAATVAGLLLVRRRRRISALRSIAACLFLAGFLLIPLGCGGGSDPTANDVPKGTYTLTLDGADTANSSIAASTTFTLAVN